MRHALRTLEVELTRLYEDIAQLALDRDIDRATAETLHRELLTELLQVEQAIRLISANAPGMSEKLALYAVHRARAAGVSGTEKLWATLTPNWRDPEHPGLSAADGRGVVA